MRALVGDVHVLVIQGALRLSPSWSLMCCSSTCWVVCSVPVFFSLLFERVPEEACLCSLLRLLRFFILPALLRCASLSLILFQRSCKPSFSCSSALLHAFRRRRRSLTKCRISLSRLLLCLFVSKAVPPFLVDDMAKDVQFGGYVAS